MYFVLIMQKVQTGLVIEFYSNSCLVRTDKKDIPCIGIKDIIVGDIVKIEILQDSKETKGVILSRENRKSLLQKKDGIKYKNIAANLSHVGILVTPKPKTTAEFIDKWILTSLLSGIEPFVICNKSDLNHDDAYLKQINLYKSLDIQTFSISAKENTNIDLLQNYLKHKCALFVGNSGAGKSTLTSLITGKEIKTNMLSNKPRGAYKHLSLRYIRLMQALKLLILQELGTSQYLDGKQIKLLLVLKKYMHLQKNVSLMTAII